jgi:tight adherence protein B
MAQLSVLRRAAGLGVLGVLLPGLGGRRRLARRARALGGAGRPAATAAGPSIKRAGESRLDAAIRRLLPRPEVLRGRLAATGAPLTLAHYAGASLAVMFVSGAASALLGASPPLILLGAAANALFLPHAAVGVMMARRRGRFLKLFAEAIGLIVRGLRAGLPVTETLGVVGREIGAPVGEEFRQVADQVRLGVPVEEAMWNAARRIGLPEFNFLVISLSVQRETGGNLAETLENLEQILRRRQQMRLKIRAMSSEATASALIIGALPFVMAGLMSVFSPAYLRALFTDPLGRMMLAGGLGSLTVGAVIMRQMVRFEI